MVYHPTHPTPTYTVQDCCPADQWGSITLWVTFGRAHKSIFQNVLLCRFLENINKDLKHNIVSKRHANMASLECVRPWITAHESHPDYVDRTNKLNKHKLTLATTGKRHLQPVSPVCLCLEEILSVTHLSVCLEDILPVRSVHIQSWHDVVPAGSGGLGVIYRLMGLSGLHLEDQGQACPS